MAYEPIRTQLRVPYCAPVFPSSQSHSVKALGGLHLAYVLNTCMRNLIYNYRERPAKFGTVRWEDSKIKKNLDTQIEKIQEAKSGLEVISYMVHDKMIFAVGLTSYKPCESDAMIATSQELKELIVEYDGFKRKENDLQCKLADVKTQIEKWKKHQTEVQKRPRRSGERHAC